MSREGSLEAPTRHPIAWRNEEFYDPAKLEAEMRRIRHRIQRLDDDDRRAVI